MVVSATPQRKVTQFANVMTSMPTVSGRLAGSYMEQTPQIGTSQVPNYEHGPLIHLEPRKEDLFQEGFGYSIQTAATEFKMLRELKVAKLKGDYSSNAKLVLQAWLKDMLCKALQY